MSRDCCGNFCQEAEIQLLDIRLVIIVPVFRVLDHVQICTVDPFGELPRAGTVEHLVVPEILAVFGIGFVGDDGRHGNGDQCRSIGLLGGNFHGVVIHGIDMIQICPECGLQCKACVVEQTLIGGNDVCGGKVLAVVEFDAFAKLERPDTAGVIHRPVRCKARGEFAGQALMVIVDERLKHSINKGAGGVGVGVQRVKTHDV